MQQLMRQWALLVFGPRNEEITPYIRSLRLLEEVLELCQTDNVSLRDIATIIDQVYSKPVGERASEVGGVVTCLVAYCDVAGLDLEERFFAEFTRIMDPKLMEKVRNRNLSGDKIGFNRDRTDTFTPEGRITGLIRYNSEQVIRRRVLQAKLDVALLALQRARDAFREYARLHRGKDTMDGSLKALRNDEHADAMDAAMTFDPDPADYGRP
jgi:NTP pyrophosphatase (non-canonical NTP hydrolase)